MHQALVNKIPVFCHSQTILSAGALFAITLDWEDIGRQAGAIAAAMLTSHVPSSPPPVEMPRRLLIHYNPRVAEALGLEIPEAIRHLLTPLPLP